MASKHVPRENDDIDIHELLARGRNLSDKDPSAGLAIARKLLRATAAESSDRAKAHILAGTCQLNLGDFDAAVRQFERAIRIERLEPLESVMARHGLGRASTERGEWKRAIEMATEAHELAHANGLDLYESMALNTLGIVWRSLGDAARALEYWQRALEIANATESLHLRMLVGGNIATVHAMLDDLDAAEQTIREMLSLGSDVDAPRLRMIAYQNLSTICQKRGDIDGSVANAMLAVEISRTLPSRALQVKPLMDYALAAFNRGQSDDALRIAREALDSAEGPVAPKALGLYGYINLMRGDLDAGLDALHRSLEGCEEFGDWQGVEIAAETLYRHYQSVGDSQNALDFHRRYVEIVERIRGREQQRRVAHMEMRAEIERVEREREEARKQAEMLAREIESKEKELASMALDLVDKSRFLDSLKEEISDVARNVDGSLRPQIGRILRAVEGKADANEQWQAFEQQFELLHDGMLRSLSQRCPTLTRTELKVCALLKLSLTTKEMAAILSCSLKTVESHRYNIRRKLNVPDEVTLTTYFVGL